MQKHPPDIQQMPHKVSALLLRHVKNGRVSPQEEFCSRFSIQTLPMKNTKSRCFNAAGHKILKHPGLEIYLSSAVVFYTETGQFKHVKQQPVPAILMQLMIMVYRQQIVPQNGQLPSCFLPQSCYKFLMNRPTLTAANILKYLCLSSSGDGMQTKISLY